MRGSFGLYYDQFRLGLARNVPAFGGTDQRIVQYLVFPRLLYGSPSFVSSIALLSGLPGGCFSNSLVGNLTDAQISCRWRALSASTGRAALPFIGVDRLNRVVAPGRSPIPANTVVTAENVQTLTGLTPQQYADQASAAIGQPAGYFVFGPTGLLTNTIIPAQLRPTDVADSFDTPHTLGFTVGVQRELTEDMALTVDYFHREMRNLLGLRNSNIAFESRVLGRRFLPPSRRGRSGRSGRSTKARTTRWSSISASASAAAIAIGASYTYADATDNSLGIESARVGQLHRHGAARHRDRDGAIERQRSVHTRQWHARPAGRHVSERSRSRQGTVRSGRSITCFRSTGWSSCRTRFWSAGSSGRKADSVSAAIPQPASSSTRTAMRR